MKIEFMRFLLSVDKPLLCYLYLYKLYYLRSIIYLFLLLTLNSNTYENKNWAKV
jgi:hypothetical protein